MKPALILASMVLLSGCDATREIVAVPFAVTGAIVKEIPLVGPVVATPFTAAKNVIRP